MSSIETLIALAVASFYLSIVSGSKRPDQFMFDPMLHQLDLKNGRLVRTAIRGESFGKLLPIVRLYALNRDWESLDQMCREKGGVIGALLLKRLHKPPSGILINRSILIEMLAFGLIYKTDGRDKFNINLDTLSGILHLLIGLSNVFGVVWFNSQNTLLTEKAV